MSHLALERIPSHQSTRREEIVTLQGEIQTKRQEADIDAARLASQRAYHFGKLPVEIANTVFSMVLADDHAYVVKLAQVCKNWRSAILGTPAFWQTLVVTNKHPKRKINAWKERSRNRICELTFLDTFDNHPVIDELASLDTQYLQTLSLRGFCLSRLPQLIPSIAPAVLHSLQGWPVNVPITVIGDLLFQDNIPSFHARILDLPRYPRSIDWFQLSDRIVDLESCTLEALESADWPHLLWLLHRNTRLTHLDLSNILPIDYTPVPDREIPTSITIPHLSSFHLKQAAADRTIPLLDLPSLTEFQVTLCRGSLDSTLRRFAEGTASRLTSLSIRSTAFTLRPMVHVLEAASALEWLEIVAVGTASAVLDALARPYVTPTDGKTSDVPSRVLCPRLQHLNCSQNPDIKSGPLRNFVKLRMPIGETELPDENSVPAQQAPVQPLTWLNIDGCTSVDPAILPWLRAKVAFVSCVYMTKKSASWKR